MNQDNTSRIEKLENKVKELETLNEKAKHGVELLNVLDRELNN